MITKHLPLSFLLLLLALLPGTGVSAQAPQAENMSLLGNWDDQAMPRYSDVWGYAAGGKEYALLGSYRFIHILDVTDPNNIAELHRLNSVTGTASEWRDIKVYGNYAYCVTEALEGFQIIDLRRLGATPSEASIVYSSRDDFNTCHNIFIDTDSKPAKLYAFGTDTRRDGYLAYSLADPANPALLASTNLSQSGRYIHDGYVIRDTLYANSEKRGMYVYDVAKPAAPVELGILNNYDEEGYNHSVWRTPDGRHAVMCDETYDTGVKIVDVSDPLDMEVKSIFRSAFSVPGSDASIAHNPYIVSNDRVVLSYYGDGIQVWEFSDPERPTRLGYYDTTPGSNTYSDGIWGAYPYLPSGNILGSDIRNGLFVVSLDQALPVTYSRWEAESDGKNAMLDWSVARADNNAGWTVEHAASRAPWEELGFVTGGSIDNTYFHETPGPGTHYYRLRQQDFDGTETYGEVRTVVFAGGERVARTYPNPAPAGSVLTFQGLTDLTDWSLWSVAGQRLLAGRGRYASPDLPAGVYLLRVGDAIVDRVILD